MNPAIPANPPVKPVESVYSVIEAADESQKRLGLKGLLESSKTFQKFF